MNSADENWVRICMDKQRDRDRVDGSSEIAQELRLALDLSAYWCSSLGGDRLL